MASTGNSSLVRTMTRSGYRSGGGGPNGSKSRELESPASSAESVLASLVAMGLSYAMLFLAWRMSKGALRAWEDLTTKKGPSSAAFRCGCCHPTGSEWEALVVMVQRGTRDEGRGQKKQKKTHTQTHTVSNRKRYKDRCKHAHAHTTNMCERKRTEHVCTCTGVGAGAGGGEATPCALLLPLSPCRRADRFNAAF